MIDNDKDSKNRVNIMTLKKSLLERMVNIILNILIVIFGVILLITIYNNIQTKVLKNSYSSFFGYSLFEVQTGSMADAINAGDWIIVKYQRSINLGDIVTYKHNGEFITHRVVEVYKETFVTKGDFNNAKDKPISREQVVGKVVKILPNFGIFRKTVFNPVILITFIITLYFASMIFKSKKPRKVEEQESKKMKGKSSMGSLLDKIKDFLVKKLTAKDKEYDILKDEKVETLDKPNIVAEENNIKEEVLEDKASVSSIQDDDEKMSEEDLEKTMFFRMVSVSQDEIDNVYQDAGKGKRKVKDEDEEPEIISVEKPKKKTTSTVKKTEKREGKTDSKEEEEAKKELELLQKKKKKFKNILEKAMFIKSEEISEIVDILNLREKSKTNEATIKKNFLNAYMDGKYYNFCGDVNVEYSVRNMVPRLTGVMADVSKNMVSLKTNDSAFPTKVQKFEKMFITVLNLEQAYLVDEDLQTKRESYTNKILKLMGRNHYSDTMLKEVVQDIIKTQKKYSAMIRYSFDKLDTNMFELDLDTAISKSKKIYAVELNHNINFSKVYSDYIVDKTYNEGIVAEDKVFVLLTLLLRQITKDILGCNFNKKYLLYLPSSLYEKEKKLINVFKTFEDEYAKHSIVVLLKYDEISKYSKTIKALIKEGYHFAVDLGGIEKVKVRDRGCVEAVDYLFMSKKNKEKASILASLSNDIGEKLIYTEMIDNLWDVWGE